MKAAICGNVMLDHSFFYNELDDQADKLARVNQMLKEKEDELKLEKRKSEKLQQLLDIEEGRKGE